MGNFGGCLWWGVWEVLSLLRKEGSELRGSKLSRGWNVVNKTLLLPSLIVGSFTTVPHGWAPVCLITSGINIMTQRC